MGDASLIAELRDHARYKYMPAACRQAMERAADALERREGWKLVPEEPTEAMLGAYQERCHALGFFAYINASTAYCAMIAAAPSPPDRGAG